MVEMQTMETVMQLSNGKRCRCRWCRRADEFMSLHRISKLMREDQRLSDESKRLLSEIAQRALSADGDDHG